MNTVLTGPTQPQTSPRVITILLEDPDLSDAVAECPTPQAQSELVQDYAEIGVRVSEHHQTDQSVQSVVDALDRQNEQARARYEQQRRDDMARWEQQRKIDKQIRDHQAKLEKQRYESQLAEQKRQFETQIENQKALFERRAQTARKLQSEEREANQRELLELNATVRALSEVVNGDVEQSRTTLDKFERRASKILKGLLGEVRAQLSQGEQTKAEILDTVEKAISKVTGPLQDSFQRASLVIQSQADREEARLEADEFRERTSNYKGKAFEEGLLNDLVEFAGSRTGDLVEHTGSETVDGSNRKVGDLVYTLRTPNGSVRVALEAKDQKLPHSSRKKYFLNELNQARKIRGAKYGIVVASLDSNSVSDSRPRDPFFKDLGEGNFLVIVDETQPYSVALRVALHWIHNLEKASSNGQVDKKLFAQIQSGLKRIAQHNDRFTGLKQSVTSVTNTLVRVRGQLDELDQDITHEISRLQELLE